MIIKRYKIFLELARQELERSFASRSVIGAHRHDGKWLEESGEVILSGVDKYERTASQKKPWRDRKSNITYFFLQEFDAVLVLELGSPPKVSTRTKIEELLAVLIKRSATEFQAKNDSLTSLFNADSFNQILDLHITKLAEDGKVADVVGSSVRPPVISVLAFDIDYFKQVNDTHGHAYGDLVLRCLAKRLELVCKSSAQDILMGASVDIARPSGEEFLIAAYGRYSAEQEKLFAEKVRSAVHDESLPTDLEYNSQKGNLGLMEGFALPLLGERRLTISVGVSSLRSIESTYDVSKLRRKLKGEADIALYRAKQLGRNRFVLFSDILDKHGRVIEYSEETGVVAVDVGTNIGVRVGQEFCVFHPIFDGQRPFLFKDGRTEKRIGFYPKIECAKIEVFDAQPEMSFCKINSVIKNKIPAGSSLEAIQLGSIGHLVSSLNVAGAEHGPEPELQRRLKSQIAAGGAISVGVFELRDTQGLLEEYGSAFVNRLLANILEILRSNLPLDAFVSQVRADQFAMLASANGGNASEQSYRDLVDKVIDHVKRNLRIDIQFRLGLLHSQDIEDLNQENDWSIKIEDSVDLARLALASMSLDGEKVAKFEGMTPSGVLYISRRDQVYERMNSDYQSFHKLGCTGSGVENQMAIGYWVQGNIAKAIEHIDRAIQEPIRHWYILLNACWYKWSNGDQLGAIACYRRARAMAGDKFILDEPYAFSLSEVLVEGSKNLELKVEKAEAEAMVDLALAIPTLREESKNKILKLKEKLSSQ